MKNNAHISSLRLEAFLDILDARKVVNIFESETESIKYGYVYEILTDKEFIAAYKNRKVIGISGTMPAIKVMISEEV